MENEIKPNIAYVASTSHQRDMDDYDNPQLRNLRCNVLTGDSKVTTKRRSWSISAIAGCALVLTILALLVAAIAVIYLGTHANQACLQNISILQKIDKILQAELEKRNATITVLTLPTSKGTFWNPATSCSDVLPGSPSGDYWIQTKGKNNPVQVYCDTDRTSCSCNTTGGWMRVANLDMTDPNQNCPAGFRLISRSSAPLRTCGRPGPAGCVSTTFLTYGVEYSHVCGRVIAYQFGTPDAFNEEDTSIISIDSTYVDGVSITHGQSPRPHIWTFIGAHDEGGADGNRLRICPCTRSDISYKGSIPFFVGQDYYCDTGSRETIPDRHLTFYPDDPLWDGQGCGSNSTCCEFNNPPWFCKQLPQPTTDDIELRLCGNEQTSNEDTPIEQVEVYIL